MSEVLAGFFDQQSEEDRQHAQAAIENARSEQTLKLEVSGRYLMEVATFAFTTKDKPDVMRTSPELTIAEKKKSLLLNINLRVVDGTPQAPKGSSIFTNITLSPAAGASQEKFDNVMRMMKPQIVALTGAEKIAITSDWIDEWLLPHFKKKENGAFEMTKDHKMKNKVMVVVEDDIYQGKPTLKVTNIRIASDGDKSVSNEFTEDGDTGTSPEVDAGDVDPDEALNFSGEEEKAPDGVDIPDVPIEPDDF